VLEPPKNIEPGRLFRLLLRRPRPWLALNYRIRGLERFALTVRALKSIEYAEALEEGPLGPLVACLRLASGEPAFGGVADLAGLRFDEAERLQGAANEALATVSPLYGYANPRSWNVALMKGAAENAHEAFALGSSYDTSYGWGVVRTAPRPDRYFGCPLADLTDGQWLAYWGAREHLDTELRKKR
jgi:hypothetical protein